MLSSNSTAFGNGNAPLTFADVGSGGPFGFITGQQGSLLFLPVDYLSGSAITAESTYNDVDLLGLGIVPGTYVYSVGSNTDYLKRCCSNSRANSRFVFIVDVVFTFVSSAEKLNEGCGITIGCTRSTLRA